MNHQFLTNYTETTFLEKSRIICAGADPFVFGQLYQEGWPGFVV